MSLAQGATVQAADPSTLLAPLSQFLNVGTGNQGYGAANISLPAIGDPVYANSAINGIISSCTTISGHQGSPIVPVYPITTSSQIAYANVSYIPDNIAYLSNNRLNRTTTVVTYSINSTASANWLSTLTWDIKVSTATGDDMRYIFNRGGYLQIGFTDSPSATANTISQTISDMESAIGNIYLTSATGSSFIVLGNRSYTGITQVTTAQANSNVVTGNGYYALTNGQLGTANTLIFTQSAMTGPVQNIGSNVQIWANSSGTVGTHGDNGNVVNLRLTINAANNSSYIPAPSTLTVTVANSTPTFGNVAVTVTANVTYG